METKMARATRTRKATPPQQEVSGAGTAGAGEPIAAEEETPEGMLVDIDLFAEGEAPSAAGAAGAGAETPVGVARERGRGAEAAT